MQLRLGWIGLLVCVLGLALDLHAQQTDNHGLHAVPTPGAVTVDGDLGDWDLSGQALMCYDLKTLRSVYSARIAFMYDAQNLYVGIHWADPAPLSNIHDPRYSADIGWTGDSVQLRINTDRVSHVTAWYYKQGKEPFINISYGRNVQNPFGGGSKDLFRSEGWKLTDGAEMAFKVDADGKGYVQEIKLPWALISNGREFAGGDTIQCGVELLWGDANWPAHRYADNLAVGVTQREFFFGSVPAWGTLKLEPAGHLKLPTPAWEATIEQQALQGSVKIEYSIPSDRRVTLVVDDEQGNRVRNLLASGERKAGTNVDYWDALDDQGNAVKAGKYTIKGIYHEGLHLKYVGAFASPGNPPWGNAQGTGAFYGDHTAPQAVAAGGDLVALACPVGEAGNPIIAVDMKGQRQWGAGHRVTERQTAMTTDGQTLWIYDGVGRRLTVWRCELKTGKYAPWEKKDQRGQPMLDLAIANSGKEVPTAIANHDGTLAVVLGGERRMLILDGRTGDTLSEITGLPEGVSAAAYNGQGDLYLAAGNALCRIAKGGQQIQPFAAGVLEPVGLACDAEGRVYVSQRGAAQNVAVFDSAGKKIGEIGKAGGRPETGFFDAAGMRNPRGIAIDKQGRLWVAEETAHPKRTSVWTADGKLAFDLVGPTGYAAGGLLNPFDVSRAFSELVEYKLDMASGKYTPLFTLKSLVGPGRPMKECKIVLVQGHEYVQTKGEADTGGWMELYHRNADGSWTQVMAVGTTADRKGGFIWTDDNGDGHAQPEEKQNITGELGSYYWGQAVGDDLTLGFAVNKQEAWVLPLVKIDDRGVPRYSLSNRSVAKAGREFASEGMMAMGRDGRIYANQEPLAAFDRSGRALWTYPNRWVSVHGSHQAPAAGPGLLIGPSSIYGTAFVNNEIGEVFYLNGNLGQNFIFTEDGLWVQSLFNDCRGWADVPDRAVPGMFCDAMSAGGESFGGGFCRGSDGKFYTVGGGTAAVVMEVTGLDTLKRLGAKVEVTERDLVVARDVKAARAALAQAPKDYTIRTVAAAPNLEGDLSSWQMAKDVIRIEEDGAAIGTVKILRDQSNLYLAYKVNDRSPLKNGGQNEREMFISGDCVDLMLRTDGSARSAQPVAGDLRLLMTVRDSKPMAMLYRPVAPGTAAKDRVAFSSPWRTIYMDRAEVVTFPLTMKVADGGYVVTAAVPLKLLGLGGNSATLRGDVGILLSDNAGQETTGRKYWSNKATNNTNDVPDEAMLAPGMWAQFNVE